MAKPLFIPHQSIVACTVHYHAARAVLERNVAFLQAIRIGDHLLELDDSSNTMALNRLIARTPGLQKEGVILRREKPVTLLERQLRSKKGRRTITETAMVCYRCTPQDAHPTCAGEVAEALHEILSSTRWSLRLIGGQDVVLPVLQPFMKSPYGGRIKVCLEIGNALTSAGRPGWQEQDIEAAKRVLGHRFPVSAFLRPRHPFESWYEACTEIFERLPKLEGLWAEYVGPQQRHHSIDFCTALIASGKPAIFLPPSKTEADYWDHQTRVLVLPLDSSGKSASMDPVSRMKRHLGITRPEGEKNITDLLRKVSKEGFSPAACEALFRIASVNAPSGKRRPQTYFRRLFEIMATSVEFDAFAPEDLKLFYDIGEFMAALRDKNAKAALPRDIAYVKVLLKSFASQEQRIACWRSIARTPFAKKPTPKEFEAAAQAYAHRKRIALKTREKSPAKASDPVAVLQKAKTLIADRYPDEHDWLSMLEEVIRGIKEREKPSAPAASDLDKLGEAVIRDLFT